MQSSSAGAASEELFDLRGAGDLVLPADFSQVNDPRIYVMDPKSPDAWRTQVRAFGTLGHSERAHQSSDIVVNSIVTVFIVELMVPRTSTLCFADHRVATISSQLCSASNSGPMFPTHQPLTHRVFLRFIQSLPTILGFCNCASLAAFHGSMGQLVVATSCSVQTLIHCLVAGIQVFRSIDSQCVVDFPESNQEAYKLGLQTGDCFMLMLCGLMPCSALSI